MILVHDEVTLVYIAKGILFNQALRTGRNIIYTSLAARRENRIVVGREVGHIIKFPVPDA
jgi:hypothetical protein